MKERIAFSLSIHLVVRYAKGFLIGFEVFLALVTGVFYIVFEEEVDRVEWNMVTTQRRLVIVKRTFKSFCVTTVLSTQY